MEVQERGTGTNAGKALELQVRGGIGGTLGRGGGSLAVLAEVESVVTVEELSWEEDGEWLRSVGMLAGEETSETSSGKATWLSE